MCIHSPYYQFKLRHQSHWTCLLNNMFLLVYDRTYYLELNISDIEVL